MVYNIEFGGVERHPDIRMLHDMKEVVCDREWFDSVDDFELYYMFRHLSKSEAELKTINKQHLRYDITVIPPGMMGREFVKTAGHYHPNVPGEDISYPEVYQVLEGEATYLLQKHEVDDIIDVVVIKAKAGDIALIPPEYGHVTINASDEPLKMANWVCCDFASSYVPFRDMEGGAYYLLDKGFVKNPRYEDLPELRYITPVDIPEFGLTCGRDMYELINDTDKLRFLKQPQDFVGVFESILTI
ncbi:glucose-6-phosphate isomerase [Methanococcoides methylutens]|uniref:glucose-6-phosphate isomerase n=1 Tax=Methanococcoides methylutens TaxID=2226 RepID=A0A099T2B3_METMT|nr:glucose-6-phosphate isomerase family protein [Methanococcoides methylutens]KGK98298.1 glucose-6-phosphate isomerase [Methanococcoides methylutens]